MKTFSILDEQFIIRPYEKKYEDDFMDLIKKNWNSNHIFLKSKALFEWQYQGYGKFQGLGFPLLFHENRLIGFRGLYPSELRIQLNDKIIIKPIMVGSLYLVIPEYRGRKLGLALQQYTMEKFDSYFAIASNLKTSAPIYKKYGYHMMDHMLRYLIPLDEIFSNLLIEKNTRYLNCMFHKNGNIEYPTEIDAIDLEYFWENSIKANNILCINKSQAFWNWRYKKNPIYKYLFFGGINKGGIIVGRICDLYDNNNNLMKEKIFRILEIIPEDCNVWNGVISSSLIELLEGVLSWAKKNDCCGAEFYTSTHRFESILKNVGMCEVNECEYNKDLVIYSYFEPVTIGERLSNLNLYLGDYKDTLNFDDTNFSLSDADQDRPNIISDNYE